MFASVIVVATPEPRATVHFSATLASQVQALAVTLAALTALVHCVIVKPVVGRSAAAIARKVGTVGPADVGPART